MWRKRTRGKCIAPVGAFDILTLTDLQALLKKRGLPVKGKRDELFSRLAESLLLEAREMQRQEAKAKPTKKWGCMAMELLTMRYLNGLDPCELGLAVEENEKYEEKQEHLGHQKEQQEQQEKTMPKEKEELEKEMHEVEQQSAVSQKGTKKGKEDVEEEDLDALLAEFGVEVTAVEDEKKKKKSPKGMKNSAKK